MEIIAHRGASAYAPENSRAALELAWRLGADRVEMDVRISADGVPFLFHEPRLHFPPTQRQPVKRLPWPQLRQLRLPNGEPILTLQEAVDLLEGKVPIYVDVKDPAAMDAVAGTLRGVEEIIVGCKDPSALATFSRGCPDLPTSLQVTAPDLSIADTAQGCGARFVHLCWENLPRPWDQLTPEQVEGFREAGLEVILWQEDRPWALRRIAKLGVFGVCTNAPDRARQALGLPPGKQLRPLASGGDGA